MTLANQHAIRHGEAMIDTEHILLGLVEEGTGVGMHALKRVLGENHLSKVRLAVEDAMAIDGTSARQGNLPLSNAANKVIKLAIDEAKILRHNYVGTEHLLLGLMGEKAGIAQKALRHLGVSVDALRKAVRSTLGQDEDVTDVDVPVTVCKQPIPDKLKPWWRFW